MLETILGVVPNLVILAFADGGLVVLAALFPVVGGVVGLVIGFLPGKTLRSNFLRGSAAGAMVVTAGLWIVIDLDSSLVSIVDNLAEPEAGHRREPAAAQQQRAATPGQPPAGKTPREPTQHQRTKPHVNVGTIGHVGHGKTVLTAAIARILAETGQANDKSFEDISNPPVDTARGVTIARTFIEYQTEARHYAHVDSPRHVDYVKMMITGAAQFDAAILVVSAVAGPTPEALELVRLARLIGVPAVVVFLDRADEVGDAEALDAVERDVRRSLSRLGYPGDDVPVVRGAASRALAGDGSAIARGAVLELLRALDTRVPIPARAVDLPFLMPIEDVFSVSGRGTVVTGRVERGVVAVGDAVEIVGLRPTRETAVTGVEMFRKLLDRGQAGDNIGVVLRDVARDEVERGQVLAQPGSIVPHTRFGAEAYILSEQERGRDTPFSTGYRPQFYFRTTDVTGTVTLLEGTERAMPGDHVSMKVDLISPIAMERGLRFAIREGGRTVGAGVVTEVVE